MKCSCLILLGLLLATGGLQAQVTVEVVVDQERFLRDESLSVKVRITNRSGQEIRFGKEPGWLNFHVERRDGRVVQRLKPVQVDGSFTLGSSKVAMRRVDLQPFFEFSPGRYQVSASVRLQEWNREIISQAVGVEVVRGTKLWQQTVGVPRESGPPEARRFILLQANYLGRLHLYVRLADREDHHAFRVLPVGRLLSFSQPEAQIDEESRLHLLFQTGPRDFTYALIDPHGRMLRRHRYDYTSTRPTLKLDEQGNIQVLGGIRRITRYDIPRATSPSDIDPADDDAFETSP